MICKSNLAIKEFDFKQGEVLLLNKSFDWTSFDLVNKIRKLIMHAIGQKLKVGHAGTLDPLASGVMIVCTGNKTKQISTFQDDNKEYIATLNLGATTPTFDLESQTDYTYPFEHITESLLREVLATFKGKQLQQPPLHSAKWVNGRRAYELARAGSDHGIEGREIEIFNIELIFYQLPIIKIKVLCSKGTYIRSLARDIGIALKSGSHLIGLIRTKSGVYCLEDAISIEEFQDRLIQIYAR
jgi:tRNA pseudouridine55 synthase